MRILITGGHGQLGRALQAALADETLIVTDLDTLDITDKEAAATAVQAHQPHIVIHAAAYTNVDGCARDPEMALRVNGFGAHNVALACRALGCGMVHISSNEVFPGDAPGGYEEWMARRAVNGYGRSKLIAEQLVEQTLSNHYIIRTAWLYAPGGRNFIHAIRQRAESGQPLRVVADEIGNPTYVNDLAEAIAQLITTGQYGVYHLVNEAACSRWAFANEILRLAGLGDVANQPILSRDYQRASTPPLFGALHNRRAAALGIRLRPWPEALADYMAEF
jgi:dTDP-4-dehydrorhamnose reductase